LTKRRLLTSLTWVGAPPRFHWRLSMLDVVMLAIGFAFFAVSIAYVYACDWL
jgi:hypothetical protein